MFLHTAIRFERNTRKKKVRIKIRKYGDLNAKGEKTTSEVQGTVVPILKNITKELYKGLFFRKRTNGKQQNYQHMLHLTSYNF